MFNRSAAALTFLLASSAVAACTTKYGFDSDFDVVARHDAGADSGRADAGPIELQEGDYTWRLPKGFRKPKVPADNPISKAKVELGRRLFFDKRLSVNSTYACASCHEPARAFTDARAFSPGATGELTPRSSMGLANIGYAVNFTWANNIVPTLEAQALVPIFGERPIELGLNGRDQELVALLQKDAIYKELVTKAFGSDPAGGFRVATITRAIATFERTLVSGDSPFDRYSQYGDTAALSESAIRGRAVFQSERTECFHCHGGFNFADSSAHEGTTIVESFFHNTALYNVDGKGGYPKGNQGLFELSGREEDIGRFKAPSLRNIALTAPYMHDGSINTLSEVIDHYARGGRNVTSGPYSGDGAKNPRKSEFLKGFSITATEKADLIEFLKALTDEGFLKNPEYQDPFAQ
jgi:cytochrome c peroxidase